MSRSLAIILATVTLDAIGMGLIMPILPQLLRELSHTTNISWHYGALLAAYAAMQFVFAPVLGALSDRFGRRPVLLISLAAAAAGYVIMALAPTLAWLYVGRVIAGICGANMAVATAYIADITPEDKRGQRFGWMSACFGLGLIAGPVLGGLLGEVSVRWPFWLAAVLNGLNVLMAIFVLPESHPSKGGKLALAAMNPFAPLKAAFGSATLPPLLGIYFLVYLVGQVGGVLWVIYGQDRYGWNGFMVGLSLAAFGLLHAISQALLTGPVIARLGEKGAFILAIAIDALAYVLLGLAGAGWMALALIPLLCIGGMEQPAIQALLSRQVDEDRQGQLQGLLASLGAIAGVIGPIGVVALYGASPHDWPGLVWILAAAVYLLCVPLLLRVKVKKPSPLAGEGGLRSRSDEGPS